MRLTLNKPAYLGDCDRAKIPQYPPQDVIKSSTFSGGSNVTGVEYVELFQESSLMSWY